MIRLLRDNAVMSMIQEVFLQAPNRLIAASFAALLAIILAIGLISLYALKNSHSNTKQHIEAVDIARDVQTAFEKQFHIWKETVSRGDKFKNFQEGYHEFSYRAAHVQDLLFNLKYLCADYTEITSGITRLMESQRAMTREYTVLLVKLEESGFKNRAGILEEARGKDARAMKQMDEIVKAIKRRASWEISRINCFHTTVILMALAVLTLLASSTSLFTARKLITSHLMLEEKVRERTASLSLSNLKLEEEIIEHRKTHELLLLSKEQTEEANRQITLSEEKYRLLVEGSGDIIFSLDEDWNILTINWAVKRLLNIKPDLITGRNFTNLLFENNRGYIVAQDVLRERLQQFARDRRPVHFVTEFRPSPTSAPRDLHVRLEYIDGRGKNEILGKAGFGDEDPLLPYLDYERQTYTIGNFLSTAEDVTRRLTRNLEKTLEAGEINLIRIALREMIINAIEHGNLEITYDEKTAATGEGNYLNFIAARQNRPEYRNKQVRIEYMLQDDRVQYLITDEGKGFDHRKHLQEDPREANELMLAHGRGITMTRNVFDTVRYNQKGNQVLLVKRLHSSSQSA